MKTKSPWTAVLIFWHSTYYCAIGLVLTDHMCAEHVTVSDTDKGLIDFLQVF